MVIDFLLRVFEEAADRDAICWRGKTYDYRWLLDAIDRWRKRIAEEQIDLGDVVVLQADYAPESIALLLALIEHRTIVVPLTPAAAAKAEEITLLAQGQWRAEQNEAGEIEFSSLQTTSRPSLYAPLLEAGHPGLVLFSSGSTGQSKGAVHDFTRLLAKYGTRRHDLRTLAFLHFDHIGGIDTLFYCLSNGSCLVLIDDRSPAAICQAVERYQVDVLPVAPTFLTFLAISSEHERHNMSSLKYVTYGAEVMPEATLQKCAQMFPGVTILQKYGTTEVGTLHSKSRDSQSLWVKLGGEGYQTRVIDGLLQIKAKSSMLGYLNAPSPFTEDGWFVTGDAVEVDGDYYRILGRDSDIINVGGEKVYPAEVEGVVQQMENVADVTVFGQKHPLAGQIVVARVSLINDEPRRELVKRLNTFCQQRLEAYKVPFKVEIARGPQTNDRLKKTRR